MDARTPANATLAVDLDRAVLALSDALDFIGVDDVGHGHRVGLMAHMVAEGMGWAPARCHRLLMAGLLHDCGVSSTREHRHLVDELVWSGQEAHCERGGHYLASVRQLAHLAPVIQEHHTPWNHLVRRHVDAETALDANLIFLVDRADSLHATGLSEGRAIIEVLARHQGDYFAPELVAAFKDEARREAFWFAQEEPSLRERVAELMGRGGHVMLGAEDIRSLAKMFGRIIDAKSPYTESHSQGVARVAIKLAEHFAIPRDHLDMLEISALLHDVGKLRIPDELLEKHGPLTPEERRRMARHAFDTYEVLRRVFGDGDIAQWAAFHHEYVSGQGYPFHRDSSELPMEARIIAVSDVIQALAQRRPYRQPLEGDEICAILDGMVFAGKLDRDVVAAFEDRRDEYLAAAVCLDERA